MKDFLKIFGVLVLTSIVVFIYFVGNFTSVYPPLEKYEFKIEINEFKRKLVKLNNRENLKLEVTDITGNYPENYNVYFTIFQKENIEYNLKYSTEKSTFDKKYIQLSLLGVYENKIGGYRKKDSDNIKNLISKFETEIIKEMKN